MLGDLVIVAAFLAVALGNASTFGEQASGQNLAPAAAIPAPIISWPPLARLDALQVELATALPESETAMGVVALGKDGNEILGFNADQPFVLASVAKVYLLAAYLDGVRSAERKPDDEDLALLDPMIRYSDNDSATDVFKDVGKEEGLNAFLASRGLAPLATVDKGSWGSLEASPAEVAGFFRMLASGSLLDAESTQVAMNLLSRIDKDQAWGVSAGASAPGTKVYLKNGWYPDEDGWRINTVGDIDGPRGEYFLAVFAYPTETMSQGVNLVEEIASTVNAIMR
jgi:hypothetical protein